MAFCKFCGKEIADGAVCDCQASQAPVNNNPAVTEETSAQTATAQKDPLKTLVAAVIALLVFIFIFVFIFNSIGARGIARKYAKKVFSKHGGKAVYSLTLSDDVYKDLKGDELDDMIDDFNDSMEDIREDTKVKVKSVKKTGKLSNKELKGAEYLFAKNNSKYDKDLETDDFKAKKGYEFKLTYKIKDKDSGDKETTRNKICVVKFKGEGWKVLVTDADTLKSYGEKADKNKDKDSDSAINIEDLFG